MTEREVLPRWGYALWRSEDALERKSINLLDLGVGSRLSLADGSLVEVVDNPRDGTWVMCRDLGAPPGTKDVPVFANDVVEVLG